MLTNDNQHVANLFGQLTSVNHSDVCHCTNFYKNPDACVLFSD